MGMQWLLAPGRFDGENLRAPGQARDLFRDPFRRKDEINASGIDGAVWHAVVLRRFLILSEGDPALSLDRFETERAVRGRAGEDHADGAVAFLYSQRAHEIVNRTMLPARLLARRQAQRAVCDRHVRVGWDDINAVWFDAHAMLDHLDRHVGGSGQQFSENAFARGVEVLHEDEGHARVVRQVIEQLREGLQTASGSADADYGEGLWRDWLN